MTGKVTIVKCKGSTNSHDSTFQEHFLSSRDLAMKMDEILGMIQGYEGKTDTTMEIMLDMQMRFEEKLVALSVENSAIKTQLNSQ